jgi:rod shape-determining protein MreC
MGRNMPLSAKTKVSVQNDFSQKETQYQNYIANLEEELRQKNQAVQQLAGLRSRLGGLEGAKLVPADIITASIEGLRSELTINRGSDDGLVKGLFVIGDNSVIGVITDFSQRTANVRLLCDASSTVQVNIPGLEINMLMQGGGANKAKIKLVPLKHKIKVGDEVLLRRKPGYLDIAMIAGVVKQCKRDDKNPSLWDITVNPVCDITKLNSVAVVVMNPASSQ